MDNKYGKDIVSSLRAIQSELEFFNDLLEHVLLGETNSLDDIYEAIQRIELYEQMNSQRLLRRRVQLARDY